MQQFQLQKQGKLLSNSSQSVIEFLISIAIFSIAFISLISLVNNYTNALKTAKERIIANFLAQEGLELVIAYRNIQRINLNKNFNEIFTNRNYCVDYSLNFQQSTNPCPLYINQDGYYTHNSSNASSTVFKRLIIVSTTPDYAIIKSKVEFYDQNVELSTVLTPWF